VIFFYVIPLLEAIMRRCAVLTVCLLLLAASTVRAEFYRWVDRDGKEFFTNDREKVPQEYRGNAAAVATDESRVSVGNKNAPSGKAPVMVREHKDKYGKGEEYWHKKAANLRMKLRDQQEEYDLVLKQSGEHEQKPGKLTNKKKKTASSLEKKKKKLEQDLAKTRRKLDVDLPEEARKADAYPGWIRE
jgi:hypothetical protein